MIATDYAKALYALHKKSPDAHHAHALAQVAKRRGHERLLPRILAEYQKLLLRDERRALHAAETPEKERTRVLVQLYKKLIHS